MENEKSDMENNDLANEAGAAYSKSGRIRIFTSFSESNEDQYRHWARLSPEERLTEFFDIMSRFYVFTKPDWRGTKIIFNQ